MTWDALELELDTTQKPMTLYERSKALVAQATVVEAQLQRAADSIGDSPNESQSKKRGGQPQAVTKEDVADAVGVSARTVRDAAKHVEAVEENPDLKDVAQDAAIREAGKHRARNRRSFASVGWKGEKVRRFAASRRDGCRHGKGSRHEKGQDRTLRL